MQEGVFPGCHADAIGRYHMGGSTISPTGKLAKSFPLHFTATSGRCHFGKIKSRAFEMAGGYPRLLREALKPRLGHISGRPSMRKSFDIVATCCCNSRIRPVHKVWSVPMLDRWLHRLRLGDGDGSFGDLLGNTFWGGSNSKCSQDPSLAEAQIFGQSGHLQLGGAQRPRPEMLVAPLVQSIWPWHLSHVCQLPQILNDSAKCWRIKGPEEKTREKIKKKRFPVGPWP